MPEGLLLVVWNSIGLWVGLVCGSEVFTLRWIWLSWVSRLLGWVELKKMDQRTTLRLMQCLTVASVRHRSIVGALFSNAEHLTHKHSNQYA